MHRTEQDAGALGGLQQAPGLAERLRQRLLNKRMQARIDRDRNKRCMSPQGRADMHGIQTATPQRFMDFGKGLRSTHAPGKRLGFRDIGVDDATTRWPRWRAAWACQRPIRPAPTTATLTAGPKGCPLISVTGMAE